MNLLFLGTGTSTGVPSLCCDCEVCTSKDRRNKRLRSSLLVRNDGTNILIDTSTDLRQQCLIHGIKNINAVLYTHHHADHVHGIDELRSFNHFNKITIPIYGNKMTLAALKNNFGYIFNGTVQIGGGIPQLEPRTLVAGSTFELGGVTITPLEIIHGKLEISGYKLNNVAYITDCSYLPENTLDLLKNLDLLILNSLGFKPHPTHFCLSEALEAIKIIQPKRTILTHINHYYGFEKVSRDLPENVELAYDGMSLDLAQ